MRSERLGTLDAVVVEPRGGGDGPVVVMLHGFGAGGEDLVPLAEELDVPAGTRWVFPAAPLALNGVYGDARAWWMLDLERLERDLARGTPSDRAAEIPDGLAAARAALIGLLDAVRTRFGVADERVILGGFSQGAMLSLDVALHANRRFAGVVLMSGTLLAESVWTPLLPDAVARGLTVVQSHGTQDGLLPFRAAERLRDLLRGAGAPVEWIAFRGAHEIPPPVLDAVGAFITARSR